MKASKITFNICSECDAKYMDLIADLIEHGVYRHLNGQVILSTFNTNLSWSLQKYFPMLTSNVSTFEPIKVEAFWYMGFHMKLANYASLQPSNIRYLLDNNVCIWTPDLFRFYCRKNRRHVHTITSFVEAIKNDDKFAKQWGNLDVLNYKKINHREKLNMLFEKIQHDPYDRNLVLNSDASSYYHTFQLWIRPLSLHEKLIYSDASILERLGLKRIPTMAISLKWFQQSMNLEFEYSNKVTFYAILLHLIASVVNMVADMLHCTLGDVYINKNHLRHIVRISSKDTKRYNIKLGSDFTLSDITINEYIE
jgi:thymidylate synthase